MKVSESWKEALEFLNFCVLLTIIIVLIMCFMNSLANAPQDKVNSLHYGYEARTL